MNQVKPLDAKRRERLNDLQQVEVATLALVYKSAAGLLLLAVLALVFNAGWQAHQLDAERQKTGLLKRDINDALFEVRNDRVIEADRILTGAMNR